MMQDYKHLAKPAFHHPQWMEAEEFRRYHLGRAILDCALILVMGALIGVIFFY